MLQTRLAVTSTLFLLPLACGGLTDDARHRSKSSAGQLDTADPSAESGDPSAGDSDPSAGDDDGGDPTDDQVTCSQVVEEAIANNALPQNFTPHPDGGGAIPLDASGCKELDLTGTGQEYCDIKFNEPLGLQSDPAAFFTSGAGDELTCGCGCPTELGACEDLEEAIDEGALDMWMYGGIALFPESGPFCEKIDEIEGQASCDWKVAGTVGQPLGSYQYTTIEIDGVLHCGCACNDPDACAEPEVSHEYAWFPSGSPQWQAGTLSKIRVSDGVEVARYSTSEGVGFAPSRVGVSLNGVAAVSGRLGGVVAVASGDDCPDPNNTSTGPDDVLAFPDGCVLWEVASPWEFPSFDNSHRALAWTPGTWDPQTCRYENTKVWSTQVGSGLNKAIRIDGDTGEIDLTVSLEDVTINGPWGMYGGVTDADGTFWVTSLGANALVRITEDGELTQFPTPSDSFVYGNTMDTLGRVFMCGGPGVFRFDPSDESWASTDFAINNNTPCAFDGVDRIWLRYSESPDDPSMIAAIDVDTLEIVETLTPPGAATQKPHGFGVDFEGRLWVIPHIGSQSTWRIDLDTGDTLEVPLPAFTYTYNEFVGRRLAAVAQGG